MSSRLSFGGKEIEYEIVRSPRSRHYRITISPGGMCRVSVPPRGNSADARIFVRRKAEWIVRTCERMQKILPEDPAAMVASYKKHKTAALALAKKRIAFFAPLYEVSPASISIRNSRTRWGSCSRRGALSFSWRIATMPADLSDYIIVHEICHLREFNHSARFWGLVARAIPDWKIRRNRLHALRRMKVD